MNFKTLLILLFLFFLPVAVFAEQTGQPSDGVTVYGLDECIKTAMESNLGLRSKNLLVESSFLESDVALAPFDPVLTFNLFDSITKRGGISLQSQISGGNESKYLGSDFEVSKQLFSGGKWSLKFETSRSESQSFISEDSVTAYEEKTTLSYTHPLLEGSDIKVNRSGIKVAALNYERDRFQKENLIRELVYQIKTSFYETLKARNAVEVAELSLEEARTLYEMTKARFDAGYVSAYDVMASESGLTSREEALLITRTSLLNNQDSLKNTMGVDIASKAEFAGELEISGYDVPDFDTAFEKARECRWDLKLLENSKILAEEELAIRKDRVKHMLALVGTVGLQGEDTNWGGAIGDMSNLSWYLGLNYTMPLGGNKEALARLEQIRLNLESINISIDEKLRGIALEITQALRNLDTAKQRVEVTRKGVELQEQKLKQEKARYELGLITSGDLLDYEEDLATAKLRYIEARADYLKAISYLDYVIGR